MRLIDEQYTATPVHLHHEFVSPVAVMDWYRRYVLSWVLSITLDTPLCLEARAQAFAQGQPETTAVFSAIHSCQPPMLTSLPLIT